MGEQSLECIKIIAPASGQPWVSHLSPMRPDGAAGIERSDGSQGGVSFYLACKENKDEESRLSKYSLVIRGIWRVDTVWHSMRK